MGEVPSQSDHLNPITTWVECPNSLLNALHQPLPEKPDGPPDISLRARPLLLQSPDPTC